MMIMKMPELPVGVAIFAPYLFGNEMIYV